MDRGRHGADVGRAMYGAGTRILIFKRGRREMRVHFLWVYARFYCIASYAVFAFFAAFSRMSADGAIIIHRADAS